jgi:hypothetical protein
LALFMLAAGVLGVWFGLMIGGRVQVLVFTSSSDSPGEVAALRGQLEATQRASDQMIEMVSTAIQVVVGLAVALAAFSWFTNNRIYERDIATIRREVAEGADTLTQKASLEVQKLFQDSKSQLQSIAAVAAKNVAEDIRDELLKLKDSFWYEQHRIAEDKGEASFSNKHGESAFNHYLDSFEALGRNRESGYGGGYAAYGDPIDALEKIVRELRYRPEPEQLARLESCLQLKNIPSQLNPAIARLRRALGELRP